MNSVANPENYTDCSLSIDPQPHPVYPLLIQTPSCNLIHPIKGCLAKMVGWLLDRDMLHGCPLPGFISAKRSEEQDLHDAYFEVFDKYRSVRDFLVDDKWQKGSEVWGREINDGDMVLFIGEFTVSGSSDGYKVRWFLNIFHGIPVSAWLIYDAVLIWLSGSDLSSDRDYAFAKLPSIQTHPGLATQEKLQSLHPTNQSPQICGFPSRRTHGRFRLRHISHPSITPHLRSRRHRQPPSPRLSGRIERWCSFVGQAQRSRTNRRGIRLSFLPCTLLPSDRS